MFLRPRISNYPMGDDKLVTIVSRKDLPLNGIDLKDFQRISGQGNDTVDTFRTSKKGYILRGEAREKRLQREMRRTANKYDADLVLVNFQIEDLSMFTEPKYYSFELYKRK